MKYSLLLYLAFSLLFSCSKTNKTTNKEQQPPNQMEESEIPREGEESDEVESYDFSSEHHFAARFNFTKDKMELRQADKLEGKFPLLIAPAFDAFAVIYDEGELVSFYAFPNPLENSPRQEAVTQAEETLLLPSFLTTHTNLNDVYIGVYEIAAYIDNWEARVRTKAQLKKSITEGFLKELYQLDPKSLQVALQKVD